VVAAFGSFGPSLAAILVEWRGRGRLAVDRLLRPLGHWRVPPMWYGVALFATAALFVISLAATGFLGGVPLPPILPAELNRLPADAFAILMLGGPLGEEIGWRGWALPRLARRHGPLAASLAVGVLWAIWHVPLFLAPGGQPGAPPLPVFVVILLAHSVLFGWLWFRTGGSLLIALLYHTSINVTSGVATRMLPDLAQSTGFSASFALVACLAAGAIVAGGGFRIRSQAKRSPRSTTGMDGGIQA
ncbi:MAG: CPBP family intramembrane metalloprotease, partial [Gemmatimonadota bacterium]|jgi:hypothetical protein